ncbi:MAG: MBL fold metallo-hydrolase, partial [Ottowia sp.]|nr:MBL fold metallo-hydrolase [Ottowia sp.]
MPPWFARLRSGATACALAGLLAACSSPYHYADPARPHHLADRFTNWGESGPSPTVPWYEALGRNLRGDFRPTREPEGGYAAFAERWRVPLTPDQLQPPPQGQARLAWLGHAGVLLQVDGQNVLIDPQLSDYAGPLPWLSARRRVPAPIAPEELPRIDLLLVTHNHYDHLDAATLARLRAAGQDPRVLVPLGLKAWFEAQGWSGVEELDWWDTRQLGALGVML